MIDLSGMSMAELEAMVSQEKDRRKRDAYEAVKAVAEFRGLTMRDVAEMIGGKRQKQSRRAYGTVKPIVLAMLRNGHPANEIAAKVGWKNAGPVYTYAAKAAIPVSHGRAAA
jgi:hypothetical protein